MLKDEGTSADRYGINSQMACGEISMFIGNGTVTSGEGPGEMDEV